MLVDAADIDGLSIFQGLAYPDLELLCRYLHPLTVHQGNVLFSEGDPGDEMLILLSGTIAISKQGDRGQHLLSYAERGKIVGDMALLDREPRSATCVAETDCQLLSLSQSALDKMASQHPPLAFRFMRALARLLSRRLRRTSGVLTEQVVG
ncbi:cyclic nucleotide-binding domain-containing protein [Pseudomarimonas arenosa]|uniref:Cyclic nucleotide-binding domain-containing protein n=1 Tax=Pseudomarimonas arenosa TaxID=2774145 RepID=A0AAW3ZJ53_9GAMM|nr:cyclic nucleotide-binding domain-containing protein [Pseudomarimonas arenosa]MBD8524486.1 cyclic nucleotide-binding domain-containing protein [Pseudomarimonas arenosa]